MPTDLPLEHVFVEPDTLTDGPAPAVVVLHGRGADEQDLLPVAERLSDELAIVSLRAPDPLMGGYTWYEMELPEGDLQRSQPNRDEFRRCLDLVFESIAAATEKYDLDADRIGLFGFSQGAITSLSLLCEDPERFAWVVCSHGYLAAMYAEDEPEGIEDEPVFVGSGTADRMIPAVRAERAAERLREMGCAVEAHQYESAHGIGPEELADIVSWVGTRSA